MTIPYQPRSPLFSSGITQINQFATCGGRGRALAREVDRVDARPWLGELPAVGVPWASGARGYRRDVQQS